jgi:hypothetical protein
VDASNSNALRETLGQRIVQAARLAVAMHLADVLLAQPTLAGGSQRQDIVGGGPHLDDDGFTDEALPPPPSADGGAAR